MEMSTEDGNGDEQSPEASGEVFTVTEASRTTTDEAIRQAMDRVDLSSTQATQASEDASFEPVPFFVLESKPVVPLEPLVLSDEDTAEENVELMLMAGLRALPESAFDCFDESSSSAATTATTVTSVAKTFADKWFDCTVQRLADASLHLSVSDITEADIDEAIQRFNTPYGEILVTIDAPLEDSDDFVARLSGRPLSRSRRQADATCSLDADIDADSDSDSDSANDDELSSIAADSDSVHAVTWTLLNVVTTGTAVALPADRALHEHIYTYVHEANALYQGKFVIEQPVVEARGLRSVRRVIFFAWKQRLHLTPTTGTGGYASRKRRRSGDSPVTVGDEEACDIAESHSLPSAGDVSSPVDHSKRPKLCHDNGDDATVAFDGVSTTAIIVDDDGRDA